MTASGALRIYPLYLLCAIPALFGYPAHAAEPSVTIELNKLEVQDKSCRAYLVLENKSGAPFESLKLDLVMFDTQGVVAKRLAVEAAPLAARKTTLTAFDITDQNCGEIGRVLLNGVLSCRQAGAPRTDCIEDIATSARGRVPFVK